MTLADRLRVLAVDLAKGAGRILESMYPGRTESKSSPTDPVTEADRRAEDYLFGRLRRERPDDTVLAEEGSVHQGTSGITWVVDPLDGTVNFLYRIPQWSVSIGIEGAVRAGVVHDPIRSETFADNADLRPSRITRLEQALVGTGFSYSKEMRARQGATLARVLPRVRDIRRAGSCALDLAWVASGRLDAFYEDDTHHWDRSAGIALIESAGGFVRTHDALTIAAGTESLLNELEDLVLSEV